MLPSGGCCSLRLGGLAISFLSSTKMSSIVYERRHCASSGKYLGSTCILQRQNQHLCYLIFKQFKPVLLHNCSSFICDSGSAKNWRQVFDIAHTNYIDNQFYSPHHCSWIFGSVSRYPVANTQSLHYHKFRCARFKDGLTNPVSWLT